MKNFVTSLLVLSTFAVNAQIFTQSTVNGSVTITPQGLQGKTNSTAHTSNVALGDSALRLNTVGYNVAVGYKALSTSASALSNVAAGAYALEKTTGGGYNTGTGYQSLRNNTSGTNNTACGMAALYSNTSSGNNTAVGYNALYSSTGGNNTAVGYQAGNLITTGSYNTFLGYDADASANNITNSTAIGYGATVGVSNKIRLGNASITVIEGQVAYTYPSDRRLKENILYTNRLGLEFISRLQTVSYSYISDKTKVRHDGFIAQDIEAVMKELDVPFSGLKKSPEGTYSLAYSDFVMPLVNAVKELKQQNERLEKRNEDMEARLSELESLKADIAKLKAEASLKNSAGK